MRARRLPTSLRVLRTEALRGGAVLTGVAVAVALVYWISAGGQIFGGYWLGLGVVLRNALAFAGPLVVAGAAWAAGRERRRGMGELLGSTARPPWQRLALTWGSTTLATTIGMTLAWAAAAVLVARVASYGGGRLWHPLVAAVSIGMLAAAGAAVGRVVPWRGAAPVAAILAFYALSLLGSGQISSGLMWMSPSLPMWGGQALNLTAGGAMLEIVWFAALTGVLLVVAGARCRAWAIVPALIAIIVAIPIVTGPGQDRWPVSEAATREVCSGDVPRVCVTQMSAFLLDDLVAQVDQVWIRLEGVEGAPWVFREPSGSFAPDAQTVPLYFPGSDMQGRLVWGRWQEGDLAQNIAGMYCVAGDGAEPSPDERLAVMAAAGMLVSGRSAPMLDLPPEAERVRAQLSATLDELPPADQKVWLGRYLTAARSTGPCDMVALGALVEGA